MKFVEIHRPEDFKEPVNKHACLCSAHFEDSCFTRELTIVESMSELNMCRVNQGFSANKRYDNSSNNSNFDSKREKTDKIVLHIWWYSVIKNSV